MYPFSKVSYSDVHVQAHILRVHRLCPYTGFIVRCEHMIQAGYVKALTTDTGSPDESDDAAVPARIKRTTT